ncbi:MAG: bifunctional demethylmenaquinone methyltransferase/2-methoxy-6-polyprenyl-1,4-benzoquinol methylase UbiE [Oligoflexales bacterium]|nr:bifunctional demethylmenaquinone methyltransferase/2-methoxy-6-polyprenyl-1,4-benzoquinol methylase UbiE [Oligoflexales bacterium]
MMTSPESEVKIAQMFDKVAPRYDFLNALLSMRQDKRWRKKLVSLCSDHDNASYLDVATGTGDVIAAIGESRPKAKELYGVDISEQMLSLADVKTKSSQFSSKLKFDVMSAEHLEFEDARFDTVSISFGLRNVIDKKKALSEFARVLKPGGKLLILEFFSPDNTLFAHLFQWYFHQILPKIGGLFSDREAYHYLPKSVGSFYSYEELNKVLLELGFEHKRTVSYLFGSCRLVFLSKKCLIEESS